MLPLRVAIRLYDRVCGAMVKFGALDLVWGEYLGALVKIQFGVSTRLVKMTESR